MRIGKTLTLLAAAGLLLGGCHRHDEQPAQNQVNETVPAPPPPTPKPVAVPEAPKPAPKPDKPKPKLAPKPSADEQVIDDADATGMTSHASHDGDGTDAQGNSQP